MSKILSFCFILCVGFSQSSTNYQIQSNILGASGGETSSVNYDLLGIAGESVVGVSENENFIANSGYFSGQPEQEIMLGDPNFDGIINIQDVIITVNFALNLADPTANEFTAADFNGDGMINIQDVILVVNAVLGV